MAKWRTACQPKRIMTCMQLPIKRFPLIMVHMPPCQEGLLSVHTTPGILDADASQHVQKAMSQLQNLKL